MRIVRREEFLKLPAGTMYCYASDRGVDFGGVAVKEETIGGDWVEVSINEIESSSSGQMFDRMSEMMDRGASYPMNTVGGRDGMFERDALFLVYGLDDLRALRGYVDAAIEAVSQ